MVDVQIHPDRLTLEVKGWHKLWSFKSRLDLPLGAIREVHADPAAARSLWKGLRAPGTHIPGVIAAGTFYRDGARTFWDVHDPARAIVFDLAEGQRFRKVVVEVADPDVEVSRIKAFLAERS